MKTQVECPDNQLPETQPGRQAGRQNLGLSADLEQTLSRMATPNGLAFTLWALIYMIWWAIGLAAVIGLRGHLLPQLLVSIFLGSQLHAITVLQHDCGHRSAYRSVAANLWVGRILAWFILMPFTTFTELHRRHHGFLGQKDKDPDEWFYEGGRAQLFLREGLFMPRFIFLSLKRPDLADSRRKIVAELIGNLALYAALFGVLLAYGAVDIALFGFVLPMLLLALVFNPISRGYEHYPMASLSHDDVCREDLRFNTITVTSRVIGVLWANINYHVEHHMYPRVPFYRLPALHRLFAGKQYLVAPYPLFKMRSLERNAPLATEKAVV